MIFKVTFSDPFQSEIVEVGQIEGAKAMELFSVIPWNEYLSNMKIASKEDVYYSPSFKIENVETKHGLTVTIFAEDEWQISYKRPKMMKKFLGLLGKTDENYMTELHDQTQRDATDCLEALIRNDASFLDEKIG